VVTELCRIVLIFEIIVAGWSASDAV